MFGAAIPMTQLAAVLVWIDAIGLAIPGLIGIRSLLAGRGVPLVLGYPSTEAARSSVRASRRAFRCYSSSCSC